MTAFLDATSATYTAGAHTFAAADAHPDAEYILIHLFPLTDFATIALTSGAGTFSAGSAALFRNEYLWRGLPDDLPAVFTGSSSFRATILSYQRAQVLPPGGWPHYSQLGGSAGLGQPSTTVAPLEQFPVSLAGELYHGYGGYSIVEIMFTTAVGTPTVATPTYPPTVTARLASGSVAVADDLNTNAVAPTRGLRYNLGSTAAWSCSPIILVGDEYTRRRGPYLGLRR